MAPRSKQDSSPRQSREDEIAALERSQSKEMREKQIRTIGRSLDVNAPVNAEPRPAASRVTLPRGVEWDDARGEMYVPTRASSGRRLDLSLERFVELTSRSVIGWGPFCREAAQAVHEALQSRWRDWLCELLDREAGAIKQRDLRGKRNYSRPPRNEEVGAAGLLQELRDAAADEGFTVPDGLTAELIARAIEVTRPSFAVGGRSGGAGGKLTPKEAVRGVEDILNGKPDKLITKVKRKARRNSVRRKTDS